jgi:predicted DNA-binding protein (MmcQ/YjbR family)
VTVSRIIPRVRPDVLRGYCLSFPGSLETFPFGPETSVFKVAGKMFALSQLARRPLRISLKCEPDLAEQLRQTHPAVLPGYHLNKRHWNTVIIDGSLPEQMIKDMIEDSFDLVVSRLPETRRALGRQADESPPRVSRARGKGARS